MSTFTAGRYRCRMLAAHLGKSKTKESAQITFEFAPMGKYGPGVELEPCSSDNRTIFKYPGPKTIDYIVSNLSELGFDRETFAEIDSDHANAFPWDGIEFDATLKFEEYEGNLKERWDFPMTGLAGKPMESQEVRALDAQFGKYLKRGGTADASKARIDPAADKAKAGAAASAQTAEAFDRF